MLFMCFLLLGETRKGKLSQNMNSHKNIAVKKSEFSHFSTYFLYLLVKGTAL